MPFNKQQQLMSSTTSVCYGGEAAGLHLPRRVEGVRAAEP